MENGPFEDVFPIEHGDISGIFHCYVSLPEGRRAKPFPGIPVLAQVFVIAKVLKSVPFTGVI